MFLHEDYGDKENADLGERYDIKSDDYPEYRLFIQGKSEPIKYTGDEGKSDKIKQFVTKETGKFYILTSYHVILLLILSVGIISMT